MKILPVKTLYSCDELNVSFRFELNEMCLSWEKEKGLENLSKVRIFDVNVAFDFDRKGE